MARLVESVKEYGVREPGLARPRDGGGYELLCGNRRKRACELAHDSKATFQDKLLRAILADLPTAANQYNYDNSFTDDTERYLAALCVMLITRIKLK